jgi:hypothetical protein
VVVVDPHESFVQWSDRTRHLRWDDCGKGWDEIGADELGGYLAGPPSSPKLALENAIRAWLLDPGIPVDDAHAR